VRGKGGEFEVLLDGRSLFSKKAAGRFPDPEEILAMLPSASS
jgi:selT/selW/selH-like putative selenoprotein